MMFRVFYTRQAYVRTFMKDILNHPELETHRSQRFANEFHLIELTNLIFMRDRIVLPCIAALAIKPFVGSQGPPHITQGVDGK